MSTSLSRTTDCMSESTIVFRPGTMATVLSALNTRNVRNTDKFPKLRMNIVVYLSFIYNNKLTSFGCYINKNNEKTNANVSTTKSSQFHGSRKNENLSTMKPRAMIFSNASIEYINVKMYLFNQEKHSNLNIIIKKNLLR